MKNHCQRKKKCLCRLLVVLFTIIVVCIIFCVTLVMLKNQKPKEEKQLMPDLSGPIIEEIFASLMDVPGKNFKASKYEVTQAQWNYIMGDNTSKYVGDNFPVTNVSYEDCLDFINILNHSSIVKERGLIFKLPNESEWRYACKAGGLGDFGNVSQNIKDSLAVAVIKLAIAPAIIFVLTMLFVTIKLLTLWVKHSKRTKTKSA